MIRKFLENLGLEKDVIDKILDENSMDIGKAKGNYDDLKVELDNLKVEIGNRDKQLGELKKAVGDNDELKSQIQKLQDENKVAKETYESQIKQMKLDNIVDNALSSAKNKKAVKALLDLTNAELDGETVKGLDEQIKKLQEAEDSKFLFNIETTASKFKGTKPGEKTDGGAGTGGDKPDFSKMSYSEIEAYYNTFEE